MAFHVKRALPDGESYALVSDSASVSKAIVYVHGFLGDTHSTWEQIQFYVDKLPDEPFRDADLFFYDYQAEEGFVHAGAANLRAFLNRIFPMPPADLLTVTMRDLDWRLDGDAARVALREPRPYAQLVLVGHSLGAVVVRRLIADAALAAEAEPTTPRHRATLPIMDAEVVLMAPAHIGFQPAGRMALLHTVLFSSLTARLAASFRAFPDLQIGCHTLTQLQRETSRMAERFPASSALRPRMLWGDRENVVSVGRFDSDSPDSMEYAPGKDHITVCKLNLDYLRPADIVSAGGPPHGT